MSKIEELTDQQKAHLVEFREKAFAVGASCEPADYETAQNEIFKFYDYLKKPRPTNVLKAPPATCCLFMRLVRDKKIASLGASLRASLWDSLGASLWDSLGASLRASLEASLEASLSGNQSKFWIAFYEFPEKFINPKIYKNEDSLKLGMWSKIADSCGWWWPYENWLIISDRPKSIRWNDAERPVLHADLAPALEYRDGWKVYCLNGIRMKEEYVMTPAEKIKPETVMAESNIDIRRELIRKVGVDRLLKCGKVVETAGEYALYNMAPIFPNVPYAPHLLMKNPSVPGVFHLEGVSQDCRTVKHAINWRRYGDIGRDWEPSVLT